MPAPKRYLLVYRTPVNTILAHPTTFVTFGRTALAARTILIADGAAGSANARLFADALARRPLGTIWGHPSGYDFRILAADFTADGAAITPGLKVFNYYDRQWGVIEAGQFLRQDSLGPGGEFFDGWYDFLREGRIRPCKKLNGQRLATKEV
jgi:hypothetical protein